MLVDTATAARIAAPVIPLRCPRDPLVQEVAATVDRILELRRRAIAFDEAHVAHGAPEELFTLAADFEAHAAMLRGLAVERQVARSAGR